jgi:two-component system LytT family response regulator
MIRVLIADDEAPARERLRQMLAAHPQVEIAGEATTGVEAIALAATLKLDLLILDIQMPGGTGLDVAACLASPRPAIVFCTAYDEHAIEAFELNAVDYLLKPVSRARLAQALARVGARAAASTEVAVDAVVRRPDARFLVRNGSHYTVVPVGKVAFFESVDGLTKLVTETGQEHWIDPPLQELEARVDPVRFFRVSRGALVNLAAVLEVHPFPGGAAEIALRSGQRLEVSRRRMRDLMKALGGEQR